MMSSANTKFRRCGIVTISTKHREENDTSGALVRGALAAAGHSVVRQRWLTDDLSDIRYLCNEWVVSASLDVIVAIGGTGLLSTDVTPEALAPLVSKPIPGFGEAFRLLAFQEIGIQALESRAFAALCQRTLVYLLPGAPQAVAIAVHRLIVPQLGKVVTPTRYRPTTMPPAPMPPAPTISGVTPMRQAANSNRG